MRLVQNILYSNFLFQTSTEAIFTNVKGRGEYNVTVDAINDNGHAISFQKNIFSREYFTSKYSPVFNVFNSAQSDLYYFKYL